MTISKQEMLYKDYRKAVEEIRDAVDLLSEMLDERIRDGKVTVALVSRCTDIIIRGTKGAEDAAAERLV